MSSRPGAMLVGLIILGLAIHQIGFPFLDLIELKTYDLRVAARDTRPASGVVTLAVIDEESLEREGRWPWPRSKMAVLVDTLSRAGARVIAFDIGFLEPDEHSRSTWIEEISERAEREGIAEERVARWLGRERAEADQDEVLAAAIRRAEARVVLGYFFHMSREEAGFEIDPAQIAEQQTRIAPSRYPIVLEREPGQRLSAFLSAYAPEANLPTLSEAAAGAGFFSLRSDRDGTIRRMPLAIRSGEEVFPAIAVASVWHYLDEPPLVARTGPYGVEGIQLGDVMVPTDSSGQLLVNYLGPAGSVPSVSATRILAGDFEAEAFRDRVVLVGTTATGTYDIRTAPVGAVFPGPEIHATVIDNLVTGTFLERPAWSALYDRVAIVVLSLVVGLAALYGSGWVALGTGAALALGYLAAGQWLLERHGLWVDLVYPLLALFLTYMTLTVHSYFGEQRERRRVTGTFGRYVAPAVVEEMLKDPDGIRLGGEEKVLTVLFSDLRGFTSYTERYGAQEMISILGDYYAAMTEEIFSFEGTLKEYVGDELLAIFGAPVDQPDHAARACRAALAMRERRRALAGEWAEVGRPALFARTGINTGPMLVGNLGSRYRFSYGVLGDDVNLGSRLEGLNKTYDTEILVGEGAADSVGDEFRLREIDLVRVLGKEKPVRVFELLGLASDPTQDREEEALGEYTAGLGAYRGRRWSDARRHFESCLAAWPEDGPARTLLERCASFAEHPPPEEWIGVYDATEK